MHLTEPASAFFHPYLILSEKTIFARLLTIANDSRCQERILLSAHLHPKGMAVSPQVIVWSLRASERDKMGGGHQHSQRWIASVHGPQGLAYLLTQLCTHMLAKKKKSASTWCNSNIFSFLFLFFPSLCPCSIWKCSVFGKKEHCFNTLLLICY